MGSSLPRAHTAWPQVGIRTAFPLNLSSLGAPLSPAPWYSLSPAQGKTPLLSDPKVSYLSSTLNPSVSWPSVHLNVSPACPRHTPYLSPPGSAS